MSRAYKKVVPKLVYSTYVEYVTRKFPTSPSPSFPLPEKKNTKIVLRLYVNRHNMANVMKSTSKCMCKLCLFTPNVAKIVNDN